MKITVDEARGFFAHPSQQVFGITPDTLPGEPFEYWAHGHVCGVAHMAPHPGVWMVHMAVKPEGWGRAVESGRLLLREFWTEKQPKRLIGWTPSNMRAAWAFARRCGFVDDGRMPLGDYDIIMSGWRNGD